MCHLSIWICTVTVCNPTRCAGAKCPESDLCDTNTALHGCMSPHCELVMSQNVFLYIIGITFIYNWYTVVRAFGIDDTASGIRSVSIFNGSHGLVAGHLSPSELS